MLRPTSNYGVTEAVKATRYMVSGEQCRPGYGLLTEKQRDRLETLFADEAHIEVEATRDIYQRMITAYREADRPRVRQLIQELINSVPTAEPKPLKEISSLDRTLKRRAEDGASRRTGQHHHKGAIRSPDNHLKAADADLNYSLNCEELLQVSLGASRNASLMGSGWPGAGWLGW